MKIRIDDPTFLLSLRDHLRRAGCIACEVGPDVVQVSVPGAPSAGQERPELEAYVATWPAAGHVGIEVHDE